MQFSGAEQPIGRLETATVRLQQPWVEGEAYEVALLTSSGGTIAHEIPVAVETPAADLSFFGLMALLGIYVGVIPVALGMLWLPWIRRIPPALAARGDGAHGRAARVPGDRRHARGLRAGRRGLAGVRRRGARAGRGGGGVPGADGVSAAGSTSAAARRARPAPRAATLALLVAVGIGLHNLGEGVAIGAAYSAGALALGAFLVVGFALHNTTEGLAIVAPIAHLRPTLGRLALLGLIAGAPAVLGAWIGAAAFNSSLAAFLFGFGAGAIVQVIVQLAPTLRDGEGRTLHPRRRDRAAGRDGADVRDRPARQRLTEVRAEGLEPPSLAAPAPKAGVFASFTTPASLRPTSARAAWRLYGRSTMAEPDVAIEHPNRKKASSKATRLVVVVLLLASAFLMIVISLGAWDTLVGAKALQVDLHRALPACSRSSSRAGAAACCR